jgi:GTP 3',8-cyclase
MPNYFKTIDIEISSDCNLKCSYCPIAHQPRLERGLMSHELFSLILDQLADIEFAGIINYHFYNEPLLVEHLDDFIEMSKQRLPLSRSHLYTNGLFLSTKRTYELIEIGVDRFYVTRHEKMKNFSFDKTWDELPSDLKRDYFFYKPFEDLELTNRSGEVQEGKFLDKLPLSLPCLIPSMSLIITLKGNVLTCYEDYSQKYEMGNITNTHLKEIWSSPKFTTFRQDLLSGKRELYPHCKKCNNIKIMAS